MAFVHSPLLRRRRRVSKALLHITDWFPTLVGLAGGNVSQVSGTESSRTSSCQPGIPSRSNNPAPVSCWTRMP